MPRSLLLLIVAVLVWVGWCVLVTTELVPILRRHVLMWPWLMAYVLCIAPVIMLAVMYLARTRKAE